MSSKILVVAAHPDDEVLGCGGTIARHTASGDEVHILVVAEGVTSRDDARDAFKIRSEITALREAAMRAAQILGTLPPRFGDFPDNRLDSLVLLDVVKYIEAVIAEVKPGTIYTHHVGDLNIDHRIVHQAVVTACRPTPASSVETLLFFEVASSTEWQTAASGPAFVPNWFVNVTETLNLKLEALQAYKSEIRSWPHVRSIEALEHLARWRGASMGVDAAEAFILGRRIVGQFNAKK